SACPTCTYPWTSKPPPHRISKPFAECWMLLVIGASLFIVPPTCGSRLLYFSIACCISEFPPRRRSAICTRSGSRTKYGGGVSRNNWRADDDVGPRALHEKRNHPHRANRN